jgi:hypothetical protein
MLRIMLLGVGVGVGVVTAALTGRLVQRTLFRGENDPPPVLLQFPRLSRPRPRRKKVRHSEEIPTPDNGDSGSVPSA